MSERFCLEGNEIKDNGFFLSGKVQYTEVMNRLNNNINQLKQQLEEKDKEIERLKDFIGCKGCVDVIKKSNEDQTQLAIQELENVKMMTEWKFRSIAEVVDYLNNRIKELKGE